MSIIRHPRPKTTKSIVYVCSIDFCIAYFSCPWTTLVIMASELKTDPEYDDYDYPTTSPNVQSGHPGHTTPEQDAQVFQLRTQLEQAGYTKRLDTLCMVSLGNAVSWICLSLTLNSSGFYVHESSMSTWQSKCKYYPLTSSAVS